MAGHAGARLERGFGRVRESGGIPQMFPIVTFDIVTDDFANGLIKFLSTSSCRRSPVLAAIVGGDAGGKYWRCPCRGVKRAGLL